MQRPVTERGAKNDAAGAPERERAAARSGLVRAFEIASVVVAGAYLAVYVTLAVQRVAYPFELEWMEGGTLQHLTRVLRGEPLFVAPSIDFVPFPYPPFYYYLAAALSPLTGTGFLTLRLISLLSSLGTAFLIFRWVSRETGNAAAGAFCLGTFIATWHASGLYFDVARLDSLFCLLLLLWLYGLRFHRTPGGLALSAGVAFLAIMTKQTAAVAVAPVALWCVATDWNEHGRKLAGLRTWRLTLYHLLPIAVLTGIGTLLLDVVDGNFLRHIVGAQSRHGILPWKIGLFFGGDLFTVLPLACLATLAWLSLGLRPAYRSSVQGAPGRNTPTASVGFHAAALLGVLLTCLIPRIKVSGAANNLIPAYAWLAVMFGVSLGRVRDFLIARRPASDVARIHASLAVCGIVQLLFLFQMPRGYLPTEADQAAGERFVERLRQVEGDVLVPGQGYLAARAGKQSYAHQMPVSDYAKSGLPDAPELRDEYQQAVRERRFAVIVDSNTSFVRQYVGDDLLSQRYRRAGWAFPDADVFVPISGAQIRPGKIWVRRDPSTEDDANEPARASEP